MMYFHVLQAGLAELPAADPDLRRELEARAAVQGWPALHAELARLDPDTARRLAPNDSQRIQRALEVCLLSGRPFSAQLERPAGPPADLAGLRFVEFSLEPSDRLALHARIAQRYHQMLEQGLLEEVKTLKQRPDLHTGLPSIRCVGYRQLWDHLDGKCSLPQAVEQAIAATRQLAKRQLTWLRSQPARLSIDCLSQNLAEQVIATAAKVWEEA